MSQDTYGQQEDRGLRVIVAGYGPVGRATVDALELSGVRITIIELNPDTCQKQQNLGKSIIHGSTVDPEVLQLAGIHQAEALIITTPDEEAAIRSCEVARQLAPKIFIAVRTKHISMAMQATQVGADHVTAEEVVTAQAMQQAVMKHLTGKPKDPSLAG